MKGEIDARGLSCPQPVILTKKRMSECSSIKILVDNETAVENIRRLAENSGWIFSVTPSDNFYTINIESGLEKTDNQSPENNNKNSDKNLVVVFSSDKMGKGDDDLGTILMKAFVNTLTSIEPLPSQLVFYNSGIKLAVNGSGVTDDLQFLEKNGVELLICGTCVNFFNEQNSIKTGKISNMFDILNCISNASRTVYP